MFGILWIALKLNLFVICTVIFYLVLLKKLTFHTGNRIYFLWAILISLLLPCGSISFTFPFLSADLPAAFGKISTLANARAENVHHEGSQGLFRAISWMGIIYCAGVTIMMLRLIWVCYSIRRTIAGARPADLHGYRAFVLAQDAPPFSFINRIYVNPGLYTDDQLQDILIHEQFHIRQWHIIDLFLVEFLLCLGWFNPLAWGLKKHLIRNLEYATDKAVIKKFGRTKESYQLHLLEIASGRHRGLFFMRFDAASLKNRLFRMNMTRSSAAWQLKRK